MKPASTGSEMNEARKPRRRIDASTSRKPTIEASVADARSSMAGSPSGTTKARSAAVRIAIVDVVLTLSPRELPSAA